MQGLEPLALDQRRERLRLLRYGVLGRRAKLEKSGPDLGIAAEGRGSVSAVGCSGRRASG